MSLGHGSGVTLNGLVVAIDFDNEKSFKGVPTTNYFTDPTQFNFWVSSPGNGTASTNADGSRRLTGNADGVVYLLENLGNPGSALDSNVAISYSAEFRGVGTARLISHQSSATPANPSPASIASPAITLDPVNWQTVKSEGFYCNLGATFMNVLVELQDGGDYVDVRKTQWEYEPYATQYTSSSRSTTQSIVNQANVTNTLTVGAITNTGNGGVEFDTNDYVTVASPGLSSTVVTVEAWVKVDTHGNWHDFINQNWTNNGWILYADATGYRFGVANNSTQYNTLSAHNGVAEWTHVAGVYDSDESRLYVNGELEDTNTSVPDNITLDTAQNPRIGNTGEPSAKQIKIIRVYNIALTADQIRANYNAQKGRFM